MIVDPYSTSSQCAWECPEWIGIEEFGNLPWCFCEGRTRASSSSSPLSMMWWGVLVCAVGMCLYDRYRRASFCVRRPSNVGMGTVRHETVASDLQFTVRQEVREYLHRYIQRLDASSPQHDQNETSATGKLFRTRPSASYKRILVTGGAGFVGSHLVDRLMMEGHAVIVVDNLFTGSKHNLERWLNHPDFTFLLHDIVNPLYLEVDEIYHLACPASPPHYQYNPIKTIKTSVQGTLNMLGLAKRVKARILLTSTSEVYGDPTVHPQPESYWGNVNPIGPRACYDEGKRVAETMMYAYHQQEDVDIRVARIFNTYGPRMRENDGRVVSNFVLQALHGQAMTIYGDGTHTRSFQFIDDLVDGLVRLMNHPSYTKPVNIGNPEEYSIYDFAVMIKDMTASDAPIVYMDASVDDPTQRRPDITTAKEVLHWTPKTSVQVGLQRTIDYFKSTMVVEDGDDEAEVGDDDEEVEDEDEDES